MSTSFPPRVYTTCPHPTAQNGHTDSVAFSPPIRAPARRVGTDAALSPSPQSIARPTSGSCRTDSKDRGRDPRVLITYAIPSSASSSRTRVARRGEFASPGYGMAAGADRQTPYINHVPCQ